MSVPVTIVDYGVGNLLSVCQALDRVGAKAILTSDPSKISSAERLVLPGVGAFSHGMMKLREHGLVEPIYKFASTGRPLLGICLGMQFMMDNSEEFGHGVGLGLVPGVVTEIPSTGSNGEPIKIPHIGWNQIHPIDNQSWDNTIFKNTEVETPFYFVHSFAAKPAHSEYTMAQCQYGGMPITAAIRSGTHFGCQFHPEKSGVAGLTVLANFLTI